jgi:HK97 family phage portal protein
MTQILNLTAKQHSSRVLASWLSEREGGAERAGINAMLPENSSVANLNANELARLLGTAAQTSAGISVTAETALRHTTVYACVSLIAGAIASLPFGIFERAAGARKEALDHEYWWMLNESACDDWTTYAAKEYFLSARFFYGDGFAKILRPHYGTNRVTGWEPIHPLRCEPFFNSQNELKYRVMERRTSKITVYDPADIIHVPSLGFDGLRSPSPITYAAREAIANGLAAEEFSGKFFSQGSTHDIALKMKSTPKPGDLDALRQSYLAKWAGRANSRVPLILTGGMEVEKLSITPADAALLPTRYFTVEEICRVFGVPPFMVGSTEKSSSWGTGLEQQGVNFVKFALRRHLTPIEQEFNRKLWPTRERFFVAHDTKALERGDFKTRMEGYRIGLGRAGEPGWLTPNEIRREELMQPVADGDELNKAAVAPVPGDNNADDGKADGNNTDPKPADGAKDE